MKQLHYYYPQVDLAMASNNSNYTAPAIVRQIQERDALLPAIYAQIGDYILMPRTVRNENISSLNYYELVQKKNLQLLSFSELKNIDYSDIDITPWGWSLSLRNRLLQYGVAENKIPTLLWINKLRELSHRRLTIAANKHSAFDHIRRYMCDLPIEFADKHDAMQWIGKQQDVYLKAPWSSSGHGVFHLSSEHTPQPYFNRRCKLAEEWLSGTISRQGSVMAEKGLKRELDFATEWEIEKNGQIKLIGLSVFNTDVNGHYLGQVSANQSEIYKMIYNKLQQYSKVLIEDITNAQRHMLADLVAPYYYGPAGIDMIIAKDGIIAPCVELNLRMTMGRAFIYN